MTDWRHVLCYNIAISFASDQLMQQGLDPRKKRKRKKERSKTKSNTDDGSAGEGSSRVRSRRSSSSSVMNPLAKIRSTTSY